MSAPSAVEESATGRRGERRQWIPTVFVWVGAAVLVSTLFVGWYVVQARSSTGCTDVVETLYPFWVAVGGSGTACPPSGVQGYSSAGLASTGLLYLGVAALTAAGAVLAFLVGALLLRGRRIHRGSILLVLALLAILAAWLGPALVALEQPSTVCGDQGSYGTPFGSTGAPVQPQQSNDSGGGTVGACNGWAFGGGNAGGYSHSTYVWNGASGPWNSFFGSASSDGTTFSWGPGVGWFLDIWGVALIGVGTTISRKN
ncbi:MAG TPA: hypothetical protein VMI55_06465 [Thermoplasmata archaeon]|nr:hypothetical protein [Thermoplasmata archaeon]